MSAQGRLAKAERKMQRVRELYPQIGANPVAHQEFIDLAEDCLVTLRSVPDHRLQDANEAYGLGIGLDEKLYADNFRKKSAGNKAATDYVNWHLTE